jgi:hypothetical protein
MNTQKLITTTLLVIMGVANACKKADKSTVTPTNTTGSSSL